LVTGATGGLGLALVEALLAEGYAVRATGRNAAAGARLTGLGAEFAPADLTDTAALPALVEGRAAIFHAAALSSPWGPVAEFKAVNVDATRALLAASQAAGADSFVYVSTPSIYAAPRDQLDLTEDSPLPPRFANAYAATKHEAERLVLTAHGPGFAAMAVRPRALVGPDDAVLLPRLARLARRGRFPLFRGGRALLELTDVRDAARALVAADRERSRAGGLAFNVSGGRAQPIREMVTILCRELGLNPRLVDVPYPVALAGAAVLETVCARLPGRPEPPATVYGVQTLAFSQTFDMTRARKVLGFVPAYRWEDGLDRAARVWRASGAL
jgi:nucleoside-diphosphate-sugar epimerase